MNSKILVAIAISALIISVAALLTGRSDSLDWHRDYASALATAKARNQMVVAYIYTDWCMYCKKMEAETFSSEQVKREAGRFVWLKLNPEQDADGARLRQQYALAGYPTILLLDSRGTRVDQIEGYLPADIFVRVLTEVASQAVSPAGSSFPLSSSH